MSLLKHLNPLDGPNEHFLNIKQERVTELLDIFINHYNENINEAVEILVEFSKEEAEKLKNSNTNIEETDIVKVLVDKKLDEVVKDTLNLDDKKTIVLDLLNYTENETEELILFSELESLRRTIISRIMTEVSEKLVIEMIRRFFK